MRASFLLPDMRGGGAERVALGIIEHFVREGCEIDLVLMRARGELLPLVPPEVSIVDLRADRIRSVIRPLVRYLRRRKPDALQVSMWPLTIAGIIAHRLARSRARLVTSDHTALSVQYGGRRGRLGFLMASARIFYPLADARVFVAEAAADDFARISRLSRSSIDVIYNPVAAPAAATTTNAGIEKLWGDASERLLTVGSLKEAKNHSLLIRAFARVAKCRPGAKLMILGDGPLRPSIERLVRDQGLSGQVIFAGFAADPWAFYASADMFLLSSRREGYPMVLIEAMLSGLPVVSTDCMSGPREILEGGRYGALVPVDDEAALATAILATLEADHDPEALKARARALSGQESFDRYLTLMMGADRTGRLGDSG